MSEHITDEELAEMEARHGHNMPWCSWSDGWPCTTRRLIDDLRAARADNERLRTKYEPRDRYIVDL